jgi:hypothetical protein
MNSDRITSEYDQLDIEELESRLELAAPVASSGWFIWSQ